MRVEIPGYRIIRPIAEGGMASVYLAMQESLGRNVAIKLLKKFDTPEEAKRFRNEGHIIASLNHRNIITIHDIGVHKDTHFISMEYLEGGDLEERIQSGICPEDALNLLDVMASCLGFLHHKGIIHRDMKPANILFHTDGTPILTDFGVARQMEGDLRLTMEGSAVGSPYYLSPEQAECKPLDGRTDIYGLGIILYEMLTGDKPYRGGSHIETILAHLTEPLPSLPPSLECYQELLEQMIAKNPDERFNSAEEIIEYTRKSRKYKTDDNDSAGSVLAFSGLSGFSNLPDRHKVFNTITSTIRAWFGNTITRLHRTNHKRLALMATVIAIITASLILVKQPARQSEGIAGISDSVAIASTPGATSRSEAEPAEVHPPVTPAGQPMNGQSINLDTADDKSRKTAYTDTPQTSYTIYPANKELLRMAQQALDDYRLTTPEGNNAYYYYRSVLEEDPDNLDAVAGMMKIAAIYANLAEKEINNFRHKKARMYIHRGLSVDPENSRLRDLENTNFFSDASERAFGKVKSLFQ